MMKIFINNVNTYSGSCFCKTFDEIKNEKTTIYGTVDDHNLSKEDCIIYNYDNVKKIISKIPKDNIVKYILKCKLVIYDLHNTDLEEIEYVIRKLKYEKIKHNMTIILISSIMTWSKTKRKFIKKIVEENKEITKNQSNNITDKSGETNNNLEKKENQNIETKNEKTSKKKDKKKNENYNKNNKIVDHGVHNKQANIIKNEDAKSNIQEIHIEEIKKKEKILYIPQIFNEKDYLKRISSTHFDEYKSVETLMLSLNSMKNIKTHVVVSGLLYGNGENVFFSIFKNAWLSKDNHIIDKGDNYIPVIHIRGLCEYIKQLYISQSKKKYLIAVDNQYITQKEIIHTIASHLSGNMNFMHVSPHESIFYEHSEKLCVNLRFQCTNIYDDNEVDEQEKKKKLNKKNKNKNKNKNDEGDISDHHKEDNHSETDNNDSEKKESNTEDDNIDSEQNSSINMNNSNDGRENSSNSESNNNDDNVSNNSNEKKKGKNENNNLKETKNKNKNKYTNKRKNLITFHCQDGFINNISIIAKEFCEFRNLKNLKVLIIGQPGVGKTFIAKKICDHYNLIMCSINMLIDEYKKKTDYTFPKYYQEYINELDNEKKKNVTPKKLTLSDLCSLFYSKLENNECKFRGFVLDFFPRNYEEAKFFFDNYKMDVPEKEKEMRNRKRDEDDTNRKGNNKSKKKIKKKKNERNDKEEDDKEEDDNDKDEDDKDEDDNGKEEDDNDKDEDDKDEDEDDEGEDDKDEEEDDKDKEEDDNDKEEDDNDIEEDDNDVEENDNIEDNDDEKISGNSENTNMLTHSDEESQSVKQMSNKKKKKKKKKKILENINKYIIMPEFVIILKSTEELCKKRMMNLPENEIIKGHNDEIGFERRHKKYINENCRNDYFEFDQKQSIEDYFIEHDIEVYTLNINENTLLEHILTNIYIFIEKNVKFNNFLPSTDEMLKNKLQEEQQILMDEKQKIKDIEDKVVLEEIKQNDDLIKAEKKRQQLLIKHQQQYIHNQSVPLRFYLIKNILPILTDALIYICKTKPKNPCLHIAQYLLENAHKYNIEEPNLENLQPEKEDEDNQLAEKPKDEK
ncbi:P-loop containing nucleoside triphosphate hydrolase, putative [Plasmodium reichenowi]|uniref:P-loop containing nucleoside triphosphate hydrolase, putative n=1 Tax=Plasmodium reichenowi TaxID=5854 RepID=A0A2P9D459_PLARE|nr:P-loop containing nucleoside triphosphate hydrolase, putative [Plasmodium reichenowi]